MAAVKQQALNETATSPGVEHANFVQWKKVRIDQNTELFKFTEHGLFVGGAVSPWWAYVKAGQQSGDVGLDAVLSNARKAGGSLEEFVRDHYAVMFGWNALKNRQSGLVRVQRVRVLLPVYGFHGPCRRMPGKTAPLASPEKDQGWFSGGAMQLYIPNLTSEHVMGTGLNML